MGAHVTYGHGGHSEITCGQGDQQAGKSKNKQAGSNSGSGRQTQMGSNRDSKSSSGKGGRKEVTSS